MAARNPGMKLDLEWVSKVRVNTQAVLKRAQQIQGLKTPKKQWQAAWLLKAVTCIDLTTLAGDDTPSNVHRLCLKAIQPVRYDLLKKMDMHDKGITTGAVCVYPSRVADAVKSLKAANSSLPVASVATGFPAGQTPLETRLQEVRMAVADGATEIDIVINRTLALTGQWEVNDQRIRMSRYSKTLMAFLLYDSWAVKEEFPVIGVEHMGTWSCRIPTLRSRGRTCCWRRGVELRSTSDDLLLLQKDAGTMYDEIRQFREACGDAHMKTILAIGELGTFTNVYKASMVSMMAGSDFIKTSTGKESVNATYPVAIVMVRAIRDYFLCTGHKVGFKPAGGIRTAQESLVWLMLIKEELGNDWLCPHLFRIGASSLLADIERQVMPPHTITHTHTILFLHLM
ncbi:hypothetical protein INR49_000198 [Caranx melampygus]|nr:hypothetical protein INR49_000198 [Caranx melampygus]